MSTKDLFNKSNKVLTKSQADKIKTDLESPELSRDVVRADNKFHSHVDYSNPENFSFYGSAEKYYEDSFNRIYQTYPYDGSQSEKEKWFYDSSELDLWIMDNAYPKSAGHIRLGTSQSVFVKGGPNNQPGVIEGEKEELSKQFPIKQGNSNIWDTSIYRNSNLYVDGSLGNTVEFWAKLENTFLGRVVLYNVANEAQSTILSATYFSTGLLVLTAKDDAGNITTESTTITDLITDSWNHVSFCTINEGSQIKFEVYKNGTLVHTNTTGTALTSVSQAELSLNINGASNGLLSTDGLYVDEFRFWKRRRTEEEIGRYWHTHIHGGTNTDDNKYSTENRKVDIGIYYKFNEGITGNTDIDSTVLDYSGRISNGEILNYDSSVRSTVSAFDTSGFFEVSEEEEPIIYSAHPDFVSARETYMQEGLNYDYTNNSSIYHTMPAWIIEEDEVKGENVKELSQVISSYFDSAQIKIKELVNLKEVEYHTLEERTNKPYSLIRRTLESAGMVVPDLFTEASAFEEILSRGEQEKFEEKLQDVKNTIYQNIYNNLSYIYKSKGTEKAFRNLIRCFGIDDELVKINLYSDGADYTLEDTRRTTAIKKKFVDFNDADRDQGLIYTKADPSNADSTSYIRGISNGATPNLSFTFETQVIFPKRLPIDHPAYDPPTNDEEHIAFLGEYSSGYSASELFDLKAEKENSDPLSENVRFVLTFDGQTLQTEYFKSVYENSKWNLAVRLVPKKNLSGVVSGGSTTDYRAELYCVRMLADVVEDEELVTADITEVNARALLSKDKYVSVGALHSSGDPETESLDNDTRLKISSTLFWYDNVTDEEIRAHGSDASNFGRLYPNEEAYMFDEEFNTNTASAIQIPRRDTLAMHWDFSEVSTTDGSGEFIVDDLSKDLDKSTLPINAKAIQFDGDTTAGQTDHVLVGDSDDFSFTDGAGNDEPFSISAWVYVENASGGDNGPFVSKATVGGATPTEYIFKHESGRLRAFLYSGSGFSNSINVFANSAGITNSTWHNVVMTYDGSKSTSGVTFYVDGSVQAATGSVSGTYTGLTNTTEPLVIGRTNNDPPSAGQAFEDKIADVCIFNKELSQAEVTEIYNSNAVKNMYRFSDKGSIISWWKMGDDLDTTGANGIRDYIGSHHGTLTNGATIVDEVALDTDNIVVGRYGWFTDLVGHQVTGKGTYFTEDDTQIVNREFIHSAKHRTPEVINSEDLVEIRAQDDLTFTKDAQVVTHFFAAEKSMYQTISDDMINLFATIVEFNDLIGQPVNRYRLQYKALEKFRARYFEKVNNVPSLEKYIELYKWIDSSIGLMLQELIPVSSNFSADLRNMVESHVLERNKYWTKFPTLEMSAEPPLGVVKGINELTYNWKDGANNYTGTPATAFINFTSSTATDYHARFIVVLDSNGTDYRFLFDNGTFGYVTGDEVSTDVYGVQVSGLTTTEQFASEFQSAVTLSGIPITAEVESSTVNLTQQLAGALGNTTVTVGFFGQTPPHTSSDYSNFTGGDGSFLWYDQRVQGDDTLVTTGDSDVDDNREILRRVSTRTTAGRTQIISGVEQDMPILRESPLVPASPGVPAVPGPTYSGQAYVTRALAKPYKLNLDIAPTIHGGSNFSPTTKDPNAFIRAATRIIPGAATVGVDIDSGDNPTTYEEWKKLYKVKRTTTITISDTETSLTEYLNGDFAYPYYGTDFRDVSPYITGQHSDSYGDDAEIPMQGPFTEAWVGGNQHRHIYYKTQTDRPEFYIDDAGVLKHPHEVDPNLPAARYTRDELAKRPINIENIKTEDDQPIGNYQRDYEVVQTSSRTKNNRWFVSNEGVLPNTYTESPYISGVFDFALPDRGRTEHVFVERFSAPGDSLTLSRGYLDVIAEEFSVYNSINYRNFDVREEHRTDLTSHSAIFEGSQGYVEGTSGLANIHKVNRNTNHEPLGKNHDNAFISHQIPRSDFQYNIEMLSDKRFTIGDFATTGSAVSSIDPTAPAGTGYDFIVEEYANPIRSKFTITFDVQEGASTVAGEHLYFQYKLGDNVWETSEIFLQSSGASSYAQEIDLGQNFYTPIYLRWVARHDQISGNGEWAVSNILVNQVSFQNYLDDVEIVNGLNDYADYQGAGYRFIRNIENNQVINQRKTNTYSQLNRTPRDGTLDRSVSTFVEPAVVWNKPNTHYVLNEEYSNLAAQGETLGDLKKNISPVTYSYSNNLEVFSNEELTRAVDIDKTSKSGFSETLMEVFKKAELLFSRSVARELIFPKHKNVGLKKTRFRSEFDTYKFFWKDKMFDRAKCSNTTKLGYEMTPEFQRLFKQKFSVDVMDNFHFHQDLQGSADNEHYKVIGDLTYMGEDRMRHMITRKDLDITDTEHPLYNTSSSVGFLGLEEICEGEATSSDVVPVYSSVEIERNKTAPIPSPQLYHNPYNESYKESEGWINRKVISKQKPAYNDYDSFSEEVKLAAQNYGLVSEFRISEHMDKYILENGGNFRAKNYDFLTLDGASHDGEFHTLSSGTSIKETSSFYSLKKEDDSLVVTAYPTSSADAVPALVKNNAEGWFGYNPIYTSAGSDFTIENSVNSEIEINETLATNYTSITPYQSGVNASGKFNLDDSNHDYLDINLDNITNTVAPAFGAAPNYINSLNFKKVLGHPSLGTIQVTPTTISIWAQPEARQDGGTDTNYSNGLWLLTDSLASTSNRACLFTNYYYSSGHSSKQELGLTFVVTDNTDNGLPSGTIDDDSTVYTFFKANGDVATLVASKMNNVVLQIVPPEDTSAASNNFLIKAWLNGEELYGVHIREFENTIYTNRDTANQSIKGYSPCPIGQWKGSGTNPPWFTNYEGSGTFQNSISGLKTLLYAMHASVGSVTSSHKFRGLLDEFAIFTGILPSSSISAIYNNGVPNNINELVANNQVVGNCLYEGTTTQTLIINGQTFSYPVPGDVDNDEFDVDADITTARAIYVREDTGANATFNTVEFTDNYSESEQQLIEASLPVWHRIGVPSYDAVVIQGSWDEDFFNSYVHTDNLNFIEKADKKHDELGVDTAETVKLKVNAIKKLLPYEGFYPQDRAVQLANLFVEKISPDIIHDEKVYKEQAVQAALQHFFAPGILYNSIKAGIACDWASYTNESGLEPSHFGDSVKYYHTSDGTSVLKYSSRMAPQWYTGGRTGSYDVTELLVTQPTSVDSTAPNSEIADFSKSITTNENTVLNSYTDPSNFNIDYSIKNLIVTKAPSKRLPFESILDPYKYLLDGRDGTQVSDSTNHILTHQNQHFLVNPSYYKDPVAYNITAVGGVYTVTEDAANSNYKNYNYPYFEISNGVQSKDNRYELSINNFIAETTKFFIKGESLSSFASTKPQREGYLMESGSTYYMDVVLGKNSEFLPVNSPGSLGGRYFGPPVRWIDGDGSFDFYGYEKDKISDAAFAPYVPPYFYASTTARISFSATETKKYSLDEIFKFSEIEEVSPQVDEYFSNQAIGRIRKSLTSGDPQSPNDGDYQDSVAFNSRMPLSASIELFGKTSLSRQEFDEEGNPVAISTANNEELDTWVIYSKFECPLFDFSSASNASDEGTLSTLGITTDTAETVSTDSYEYTSSYLDTTNTERFTTDKRTGSGIWSGYGSQVDGKGVTISIRESFPKNTDPNVGSLIEVCGFTPETKQVGRVADSKEISEAVLMIPFLDDPLTTEQRLFGGESRQVYATVNVDDRNFIKINNLEYRKQKRDFDKNQVIYTTESGEEIRQTSITNMIEGMRNYNVPPLFDFETYDEAPFAMYFFEFKHTLDREDLSKIWQGLQPKVAKEASLDSVEISHEINSHELFGNLGEIPKGVRWMVFKVKKKAEKSYYNLTEDSRDDSRFKFDFEVGTKEPEYGYNYPYDYFTMLEMIQVEANAEKEIDPVEQYRKRKGESE